MLNQVQHDVRYILEMPDHVRHDEVFVSLNLLKFNYSKNRN